MVDDNDKLAQRLRRHALRAAGAAQARARQGHSRFKAYLLRYPPAQRAVLIVLWGMAALLALLLLYVLILIPLTPGISDLRQARSAQASVLVSSDGKQLATFEQGLQERVRLDQVSPHVVKALVATEDHRFYDHHGIDFRRSVGAVLYTLKGDSQGGSTITQQLARNMFPEEIGRSRNLNRKLKEMITAIKIEATYTKDEILEAYLNTVPFLYNTFGIEMAARTYFDKPAARLDILESATLVGMLKGTKYYNPVTNAERSVQRRNVVLGQMLKHGVINEARFKALKKRPLRLHFERQPERGGTDSHFSSFVRKWMIQWADENDYNLQLDGLVVQTTLDSGLQQAALRAVARQGDALQAIADVEWSQPGLSYTSSTSAYAGMHHAINPFEYFWKSKRGLLDAFIRETPEFKQAVEDGEAARDALKRLKSDRKFMAELRAAKTRLETGFVAIDPQTGEVKAWVGSRDFRRDQYDHVAQAARQPGSTFKPIVYGAALEKGMSPERPYVDAVLDIKAGDGKVWRPTDMSGSSGNRMTLREGLVYSKNTITAQVMQDVGLPGIIQLARDLGIKDSALDSVPSLALGTSPVTLLEMVSAYSTIAAQGEYRPPVFVKRITDRDGKVIAEFGGEAPRRAMSNESAVTLIDMMRGVINRGTGTGVRYRFGITADVAGKTGTTQKNADGWFILMHPNLVAGAWVGFNDNRVAMRSNYWGQGGHNAILVVGDFFKAALESGKVDPRAVFPGAPKPAPVQEDEQPVEVEEQPGELYEGGIAPAEPVLDEPVEVEGIDEAIEVIQEPPPPDPQRQFDPVEVPQPQSIEPLEN
ncbi:penicillin-binding protein 1A [Massilia cavernae]|uniref:Penicillin-binding protein n=1 Tax=Massilia cavernae TaxID=2320864 RepID=A0A418Y889_9BURK|nr:transglycosylase domain-containing protein [Massilia cavernae]RJG27463.1 penicillin-binding protein [Massilia cavernae]